MFQTVSYPLPVFFSLFSNPRLPLFQSLFPSFPIPDFLFFNSCLPLFQSQPYSFSLPLLPLGHPLSPFSIHPSHLSDCSCQLTLILFPLPTFPLLAAIINKKWPENRHFIGLRAVALIVLS